MKAVKIALVGIGGSVALILVAAVLLSFPGVQRMVAQSVLRDAEREADIDYVRLRWSGLVARDVSIREHGEEYRIGALEADFSLWNALVRREVRVGRLVAEDVFVDLTESVREADEEPFDGVLSQLDFPFLVWVDEVDVRGVALVDGGAGPVEIVFALGGGGVAPGETGTLTLSAGAAIAGRDPVAAKLDFRGRAGLFQAATGGFERVEIAGRTELNGEHALRFLGAAAREDGLERYWAEIVPGTDDEDGRWLRFDATFHSGEGRISGTWELDVDDRFPGGAFIGERLVDFHGTGSGEFTYEFATGNMAAKGAIVARVEDPGAFDPELAAAGPLEAEVRFDIGFREDTLRVTELEIEAGSPGEAPLLSVRNFEPVRYDFRERAVFRENDRQRLATVRLRDVPAGWVPVGMFAGENEWAIESGSFSGELEVAIEDNRIFAGMVEPFVLRGLTVRDGEKMMLENVEIRLLAEASVRHDGEGLRGQVEELVVRENGMDLVRASGGFSDLEQRAWGQAEGNLGALARQPVMEVMRPLQAGRFDFDGEFSWSERARVSARADFHDGIAGHDQVQMPSVAFRLDAEEIAKGRWRIEAPLGVGRAGRESDLAFAGEIAIGNQVALDLVLTGGLVHVEDFLSFAGMFDDGAGAPEEGRHENPVWQDVFGRIDAEIARLVLPGEHLLQDFEGEIHVAPEKIESRAGATGFGGPVTLVADIDFDTGAARPYRLRGEASIPNLDLGAIFRREGTNGPPAVEGIFAMVATVEAEGINPPELADRLRGRFSLESSGGSYRMLRSDSPIGGLGPLAGLLGDRTGDFASGLLSVAESLSHIRYDRLTLEVVREEDLDIHMHELFLDAPEVRLRGSGVVRHRDGVPLLRQPMTIEVDFGASGGVARLLDTLGALESAEENGYRPLKGDTFRITGSLARPDAGELYRLLARGLAGRILPERETGAEEEAEETRPRLPRGLDALEEIFQRTRR